MKASSTSVTAKDSEDDVKSFVLAEPPTVSAMTTAVALVFCIDEALDISVVHDGLQRDMRGRWDKVQWRYYRVLADGIQRILAYSLGLTANKVKTDASLLCGEATAVPRIIVEVPAEYREQVATEEVLRAVQHFVACVMGKTNRLHGNDEVPVSTIQMSDRKNDEINLPKDEPPNAVSPLYQAETIADQVLSRVGGATLPVQCRVEMEGWQGPIATLSGKCADKPEAPPSDPRTEIIECVVDGYIRSRHTVYLIQCNSNGVAREVAMGPGWEDLVADYALSRGHRFTAQIQVVQQGHKATRELVNLVKADERISNDTSS